MFNHTPGTLLNTTAGKIKILDDSPGFGGEGQGYRAELNGKIVFYKAFNKSGVPPRSPAETLALRIARTKALVAMRLHEIDPRLNAPFAYSDEGGYLCEFIENLLPMYRDPMDGPSFLTSTTTYAQRVDVGGQLIGLVNALHAKGIAHGDINSNNVGIVMSSGGGVRVHLIDFGNANWGDRALPPLMAGSEGSMAYWLRSAGHQPDRNSDVYSVAMIIHELLLIRPVIAGATSVLEMIDRLSKGAIPGDQLRGTNSGTEIGLPFEVLTPELQSLLRLALQPTPQFTPVMQSFETALGRAVSNLVSCPCGVPFFWHLGKKTCPGCGVDLSAPITIVQPRGNIPLHTLSTLGRSELGNDAAISAQHFRAQPTGIGRARVEVLSQNGLILIRGTTRSQVPQGQCAEILAGDQIELGLSTILHVS